MKLISFRLGSEWFAIRADISLKVTRPRDITPIAAAPAHVAGIASIGGQVATILRLEEILQIDRTAIGADRRCVILKPEARAEHLTGFLADMPVDLATCEVDEIKAPFQLKENTVAPYVKGLLPYEGNVLRILDMEAILSVKRGYEG